MISFFAIKQCAKILFESILMMNSMFCIKSNLFVSKLFRNVLVRFVFNIVIKMFSVVFSKYWIIFSLSSSFSFSSLWYFKTYWRKRLMFLNWEYRFEIFFSNHLVFFLNDSLINIQISHIRNIFSNVDFEIYHSIYHENHLEIHLVDRLNNRRLDNQTMIFNDIV